MDAVVVTAELDAIRLTDWIQDIGLSRSTVYELMGLLGVEPEARRVPGSRRPASHLSATDLERLRPWADEIRRGATLPQVRARIGRNETIREINPGSSEIIQKTNPGLSQKVQTDLSTALAAALTPPPDPLRRAKALAEAAELGVALSNAELAEVLGLTAATISRWSDGHLPRPGFILRRQKISSESARFSPVWWIVERS